MGIQVPVLSALVHPWQLGTLMPIQTSVPLKEQPLCLSWLSGPVICMAVWKCCQTHPPCQLHLVKGLGQLSSVTGFPCSQNYPFSISFTKTTGCTRPAVQSAQGDRHGDRCSHLFLVSPLQPPWQRTTGLSATCSMGVIRSSLKRKGRQAMTLKQETTVR